VNLLDDRTGALFVASKRQFDPRIQFGRDMDDSGNMDQQIAHLERARVLAVMICDVERQALKAPTRIL
jgi:hypothetical protein